jgi:hypothetical protein
LALIIHLDCKAQADSYLLISQLQAIGSYFTTTLGSNGKWGINRDSSNNAMDLYVWGAHVFRSDLGGMVDNPDQPPLRASYVPTTSSAVYLPRIGHHVYNGSAWANEGLLAESESRTNLIEHSNELDGSTWSDGGLTSRTADEVGPDGVSNSAYTLTADTSTGSHHNNNNTAVTAGNTYTGSIYVKKGTQRYVRIGAGSAGVWGARVIFDLDNGAVDTVDNGSGIIKEVGNGWYRCSVTGDVSSTTSTGFLIQILDASKNVTYTGAGTETVIIYGAQVEIGSTPSSLIPTSGSSVTRAAESFTIPSANLPWPEPNYIGSELVTSGTFDDSSALDDWTGLGADIANTTFDNGTIKLFGNSAEYQAITTVVGKVYAASVEVTASTATNSNFRVGTTANGTQNFGSSGLTVGSHTFYFVATATTSYVTLKTNYAVGDTAKSTNFDNVSVREIDPLSVSIAMDGRMTFSDNDDVNEVLQYRWFDTITDRIQAYVTTGSANTGKQVFYQEASDVVNFKATAADHYEIDSTPTELPDLSATDMQIAYIFMGTIGTFRVWDRDITDDGLIEATNPSLEPSLSLTFEGTGTNSFVVNDWSE